MQTKKRAKPVKFGKNKEVKVTKEAAEADMNSDEAKEIKQLIEEKTHPKDEEELHHDPVKENDDEEAKEEEQSLVDEKEALDDEPEEIKLSKEPEHKEDKDKEDKMALETTEPTTEVEPDELHEKETDEESKEENAKPSAFGSFTNEEVSRKRKKGYFGFFLLVATITFFAGLLVIGGLSYFMSAKSDGAMRLPSFANATPTPTMAPAASPTPEQVDLSAYSIRVLNGSGITGEAAKVKDALEGKGFTVASVGNAATSDYTKTVLSAKDDIAEAFLNELIKSLQDQYSVNSVVEDAPSSQTADVVVTVGSDSSE